MCSVIPHTELLLLLLTVIPLRSHWSWKYIPLKQKDWTFLILWSWLCWGISQNPQINMNTGLSYKWLHIFLNRWQDRTSSLSHCTLIIYKRLGLDKTISRYKSINELLLHISKIILAARNRSEIIFTCSAIMTGTESSVSKQIRMSSLQ